MVEQTLISAGNENRSGRRSRTIGFSVVEIVIACAILALAIVPTLELFSGAGRQARQTSDYSIGLTLWTKVGQELHLANWENPHLTEMLQADVQMGRQASVVDGKSPFFRTIEDDALPYAEIQAGQDLPITGKSGPIYDQLRSFTVGFRTAHRFLPTTGEVVEVDLSTDWIDFRTRSRSLEMPVVLPRIRGLHEIPELIQDRVVADEIVRRTLFPEESGKTLTQVASDRGADLSTLRQIGDVAILVNGLAGTWLAHQNTVSQLTSEVSSSPTPLEAVRPLLALARKHEARAAVCLQVMVYLYVPLEDLARSFTLSRVGLPPPKAGSITGILTKLRQVSQSFTVNLEASLSTYVKAYGQPYSEKIPPRLRTRVLRKIVELAKLKALTCGPNDLTFVRTVLTEFRDLELGRNANFAEFAIHELEHCQSLESLKASYPISRVGAWQRFGVALDAAISEVNGE